MKYDFNNMLPRRNSLDTKRERMEKDTPCKGESEQIN
jgi:hypothetical protein